MVLISGLTAALPGLGGCPLPIPSNVQDVDGGLNSPPIILSATPDDFAFPGPVIIDADSRALVTLHVTDNDVSDVLSVRFYRDYAMDNRPVNDVSAPASNERERLIESSVATWCIGVNQAVPTSHTLEVVVADRAFLDNDVEPFFRAVAEGGFGATRSWNIVCNPPE